ncbi:MAG: hypothetical protein Q9219_000685 [cf. Caloplaca sp. 3 TL-2023]
MAGEAESFVAATCLNVRPGECCKTSEHDLEATTKVLFRRLLAWDIAAVWRDDERPTLGSMGPDTTGCSGPLIASQTGPGAWLWRQPSSPVRSRQAAQGASYVRIPSELPPDPRIAYHLVMEGLLGLVWSGGGWFSSPSAQKLLGSKSGLLLRKRTSVDTKPTATAIAYARPPRRVRYPDLLEINGSQYTLSDTGTKMYTSQGGKDFWLAQIQLIWTITKPPFQTPASVNLADDASRGSYTMSRGRPAFAET